MPIRKVEYTVLDLIESAVRTVKVAPMNLGGYGGAGGGAGVPPGGFIGKLPQWAVAYDITEAATLDTLPSGVPGSSGWSLVDNLNHIRYRLDVVEASGVAGTITVIDDNELATYTLVDTIHFSGAGVTVLDLGNGDIQVSITATGSGGSGDLSGYVPYLGATQNVNLGNRNLTVSGVTKLGDTQIREGEFLQIGATHYFGDTEANPSTSYIAFGGGVLQEGGWVRIREYRNDSLGVTIDGETGLVLLAGYSPGFDDIEAFLGDIDGGYHGYHLKIYSGGAEFNSNVNIPSGFTYNINGVPHTHDELGNPLTVQDGNLNDVSNVDLITFVGATVVDAGGGEALVLLPTVTVKESDGSPEVDNVDTIIFSGLQVFDLGSGDVLVAPSGGWIGDAPSDGTPYVRRDADWESMFNDTEGTGVPSPIGSSSDGTSLFAARRDHVHDIANGSAVLGSAFTLNATSGTFQDTGLSVTLPWAGTYKITANVRGALKGNTGSIWFIVAKLYNSTDAAYVTNSERMVILTGAAAIDAQNAAAMDIIVTVGASKTMKIHAARLTDGTFTLSEISSDSNGRTTLMYENIG